MGRHLPVPVRRVGRLPARRQPQVWAGLWSVDGGGRRLLAVGVAGFVAGTLLPLLLVGVGVVGLLLGCVGSRAAAAPAPSPVRIRRLAARSTPTLAPPPPATPTLSPGPLPGPFTIEVSQRDLEPASTPDRSQIAWPVRGDISQGFGCSVYYTGLAGPGCPADAPWFHDGLDIAAPVGAPVRAGMAGTVLFAGPDGSGPACEGGLRGYGRAVVIESGDGWQALYAHLDRVEVTAGEAVGPETVIGAVGDTGCAGGPHLHFGLRQNGVLLNPLEVLAE